MPNIDIPALRRLPQPPARPATPLSHTHTNQDSNTFSKWEKELKKVQKLNFKY